MKIFLKSKKKEAEASEEEEADGDCEDDCKGEDEDDEPVYSYRAADDENNFDPAKSLRYQFQLLQDGYIQDEEPDELF